MTDNRIDNPGGPSQVFLENKEEPTLRIQADSGRTAPLERGGAVNTASECVVLAVVGTKGKRSSVVTSEGIPVSVMVTVLDRIHSHIRHVPYLGCSVCGYAPLSNNSRKDPGKDNPPRPRIDARYDHPRSITRVVPSGISKRPLQ